MRLVFLSLFFVRQKTAYEIRISDWSSDVCSADLLGLDQQHRSVRRGRGRKARAGEPGADDGDVVAHQAGARSSRKASIAAIARSRTGSASRRISCADSAPKPMIVQSGSRAATRRATRGSTSLSASATSINRGMSRRAFGNAECREKERQYV